MIIIPNEFVGHYSKLFNKWTNFSEVQISSDDEFFTCVPFLNVQIQEMMVSMLVSWEFNKKIEIDKYNQLKYIENKKLLENIQSVTCKYKKLIIGAYLTNHYQHGVLNQAKLVHYIKQDIPENILEILKQLHKRIKKMVRNKKIIEDPLFDNETLSISDANGWIIEDSLSTFRASKNNVITKTHIQQLIFSWYLNKQTKRYEINSFLIFNPLYNSSWKIDVKDIDFDLLSLAEYVEHSLPYTIIQGRQKWERFIQRMDMK